MNATPNTTTESDYIMPAPPTGWVLGVNGKIYEDTYPTEDIVTRPVTEYTSARDRAIDNWSAEDLDRKCTEVHEYNTAYRARHGL